MKKVLLFLATFTLFFVLANPKAEAAKLISVWEQGGNVLVNQIKGAYYNSAKDVIYVDFYGSRLKRGEIQYYHDSGYTQKGAYNERTAVDGSWIVGVQLSCTGWYEVKEYYADGTHALTIRVQIDSGDLKVDKCNSDHDQPSDDEIKQTACATKICECIADLKASTDAVKNSVDKVVIQLETLNKTTTEIKGVLKDFSDEFKTNMNYEVKPFPDVSDLMDKNKPQQNEKPFKDDTTYFKDEGDAPDADPGKLPSAPGVKDWEGFKPESPMPPEEQLTPDENQKPDEENKREPENDRDLPMLPDKEMLPDKMNPDKEMDKTDFKQDSEMSKDHQTQEKEPTKDGQMKEDSFTQDGQLSPAPELDKTHQYSKTTKHGE